MSKIKLNDLLTDGFKGFCSVFVTAAFAYSGTELVGLAAAETDNPRKTLPRATKQVFWRVAFFYIVSLLLVGFLVPYDDDRLLNGSGATASPFVIAIQDAGIKGESLTSANVKRPFVVAQIKREKKVD